jgi:Domain of unknown function (DUF4124)
MRLAARTLLILATLAGGASLAADVWRWTDGQGVVHYSDVPVPGAVRVKKTNAPAPSGSSAGNVTPRASATPPPAGFNGASNPIQQTATAQAVQQDLAKKRSEQCKTATERYESLIASHRVYREDKPGERTYLSAKELDEARVSARQDRDTLCASSAR